jgi:hypothetical protein
MEAAIRSGISSRSRPKVSGRASADTAVALTYKTNAANEIKVSEGTITA